MSSWLCVPFHELTVQQLYDILSLRAEVFVVEQDTAYLDVDYRDRRCLHIMCYEGNLLTAYCRVFPTGAYFDGEACIGRVVVSPKRRGTGLGHELIEHGIEASIKMNGANVNISISAQLRLRRFYEAHGFVKNGTTFPEDGITHIHMTRKGYLK